jgi:predicted dehydrogenase
MSGISRRTFLGPLFGGSLAAFAGYAGWTLRDAAILDHSTIPPATPLNPQLVELPTKKWEPFSDKILRVGVVGCGQTQFGSLFYWDKHPNVEVVAVSDLDPVQCNRLYKNYSDDSKGPKMYQSLKQLLKAPDVDAVFVATDAPSHCEHVIECLAHGKHVACAVPAVFGSVDEAYKLREAVNRSGLTYMMFETSMYRRDCYAMRTMFAKGELGKRLVYSEGDYFHYFEKPLPSYKEWRRGIPPQWYSTHATAYHVCVTGTPFTQVSCLGEVSRLEHFQKGGNVYGNQFGTETAMYRTADGGIARMIVSWDTKGPEIETGRVRGENNSTDGLNLVTEMPGLPPNVKPGAHGGSHGYLMCEFVEAVLKNRPPAIGIGMALNLTVPGIVAHESAMKGGIALPVPQF